MAYVPMTAGGASGTKTDTGTITGTGSIKTTLGYKPSFVSVVLNKDATHFMSVTHNDALDTTKNYIGYLSGTNQYAQYSTSYLTINNDGFTTNFSGSIISSYGTPTYFAAE